MYIGYWTLNKYYYYYKEITHIYNVNVKLAFHKVTPSHPHYLTFTLQTYHHPEHRFRACPTRMTSPSHLNTQARVQHEMHTTIPT